MDPRPTWQLVLAAIDDLRARGQEEWQLAELVAAVQGIDPDRQRGTIQPIIQGMTHGVGDGPPAACGKVLERPERGRYRLRASSPGERVDERRGADPLEGFSEPRPFTAAVVREAPEVKGVHVVWDPDEGEVVYVGQTGNLRSRLRGHLSGSVLSEQVADHLSREAPVPAVRADVVGWLGRCSVAWKPDDDPVQTKRRLVELFDPRFNRLRVSPRADDSPATGERRDEFVHWASRLQESFDMDRAERAYKLELINVLAQARQAFQNGEPWLDLLKQAIRHRNNNLMTWRLRPPFLEWVGTMDESVMLALHAIWDDALADGDAVQVFCDQLPEDVVAGVGTRVGVASLLRTALNAEGVPVIRPQTFSRAYALVGAGAPEHQAERDHFDAGIVFCDRFIDEADAHGLVVRDRLDAQGLIWAVANYPPPSAWSTEEQDAFTRYRAGRERLPAGLAGLVRRFQATTGYSVEGNPQRDREREEMASALTETALNAPDLSALRRLAGPAYGSPGPQPGFNRYLQDDVSIQQVSAWLMDLLHGDGTVVQRIDRAMDGPQSLKGVKEAMVTKVLAVADPGRWIPSYMTRGDVGKRRILEVLGLPASAPGLSLAEEIVDSNDRLRAALEPHFPDDPWGMQDFSWWLLKTRDATDHVAVLADEMLYDEGFVRKVFRLLEHKPQLVLYGPPGTGKTYFARSLATHLAQGGGEVELVQFHPSYAYEDFVEGYRPRTVDGQLVYEVVDGPLKRLALTAAARQDVTHVLIIDEFNRALVSKVLGELYFLLEYRDAEVSLQYSATPFTLPNNLVIIATMNTADRSIALVDAALRRRFHFVGLYPDQAPVDGLLERHLVRHRLGGLDWLPEVVREANSRLRDRHLAIGPSHFLREGLTAEEVALIWEHSVLPYVEEQFLDDPHELEGFELDVLRAAVANHGAPALPDGLDEEAMDAPDPAD